MLRRGIGLRLKESLADTPVVLLTGARQSGKSTLAQTLVPEDRYFTLAITGERPRRSGLLRARFALGPKTRGFRLSRPVRNTSQGERGRCRDPWRRRGEGEVIMPNFASGRLSDVDVSAIKVFRRDNDRYQRVA